MQRALRLAPALAGALLLFASASQAADGIKASASASREVPADILSVSFTMTERFVPGEGSGDPRGIFAKSLEEKGIQVLTRSARHFANPSAYGAPNMIKRQGDAREPFDVRRQATFRITGFKHIEDVLEVLGRHGLHHAVTLSADHSKAEAVRAELRKEAIERAIAEARHLAAHAGVKTSGVLDLNTQPSLTVPGLAVPYAPGFGVDQNLIDAGQPGELPRVKLTVTANVVLGIKAD
jgi:uncharacterized protein YggE